MNYTKKWCGIYFEVILTQKLLVNFTNNYKETASNVKFNIKCEMFSEWFLGGCIDAWVVRHTSVWLIDCMNYTECGMLQWDDNLGIVLEKP